MFNEMRIDKEKLPKDMSYPLRSSALQIALDDAGITIALTLYYGRNSRSFFRAHFLSLDRYNYYEHFILSVGAVPRAEARGARDFVETSVMPDFISWAEAIQISPPNSPRRRESQIFERKFTAV
jgi:hypothetical protein